MSEKFKLTAERLREVISYDPNTGEFIWIATLSNAAKAGTRPSYHSKGYLCIKIDGKLYKAHRLAWLFMTGDFPPRLIDHINGIRDDNRFSNLREATKSENQQNLKRAQANNKSGFLGVYASYGKWRAAITLDGKLTHIGSFKTPEIAHAAYLEAKRIMHPACTI